MGDAWKVLSSSDDEAEFLARPVLARPRGRPRALVPVAPVDVAQVDSPPLVVVWRAAATPRWMRVLGHAANAPVRG